MNSKQFYNKIGEIDDDLIVDAQIVQKKGSSNKMCIKLISVAAGIILIIGIVVIGSSLISNSNNAIHLTLSKGNIKVYYTNNAPILKQSSNLVRLSENEIFTKCDTTIFKGTVTEIKNITINLNGEKIYKAIAKIKVSKVYRGNCNENDTISVLLPCAISNNNIWVEDTGIVSEMREGMTGIFMPIQYNESSIHYENGTTLYLNDVADYGLMDGERFAFLETEKGLVYSKWDFESIPNAESLEDIEHYIESMIQ